MLKQRGVIKSISELNSIDRINNYKRRMNFNFNFIPIIEKGNKKLNNWLKWIFDKIFPTEKLPLTIILSSIK